MLFKKNKKLVDESCFDEIDGRLFCFKGSKPIEKVKEMNKYLYDSGFKLIKCWNGQNMYIRIPSILESVYEKRKPECINVRMLTVETVDIVPCDATKLNNGDYDEEKIFNDIKISFYIYDFDLDSKYRISDDCMIPEDFEKFKLPINKYKNSKYKKIFKKNIYEIARLANS
ncbi:hypothetical protein [Clostridium sp.]|uniref:hypothetical protein n=1 Tax=Clostridium sp. TaxID=1506 RepID=UPI001B56F1AB|nr:hypothetical protein [Clostridium sp.]MBP3916030.1 hypothetical protein [Clostridium sp.]